MTHCVVCFCHLLFSLTPIALEGPNFYYCEWHFLFFLFTNISYYLHTPIVYYCQLHFLSRFTNVKLSSWQSLWSLCCWMNLRNKIHLMMLWLIMLINKISCHSFIFKCHSIFVASFLSFLTYENGKFSNINKFSFWGFFSFYKIEENGDNKIKCQIVMRFDLGYCLLCWYCCKKSYMKYIFNVYLYVCLRHSCLPLPSPIPSFLSSTNLHHMKK